MSRKSRFGFGFGALLLMVMTAGARAEDAQPIIDSLNTCVDAAALTLPSEDKLAITLTFTPSGDIRMIEIDEATRLSAEKTALFRAAVIAIADCAPFPGELAPGGETKVALLFKRTGFTAVPAAAKPEATLPSVQETPPAPVEPGTEQTEGALALGWPERVEIQRRLGLLGYNTYGVDGAFGPATRAAIKAWQKSVGTDPSGFLSASQIARLQTQTKGDYEAWQKKPKWYRGHDGCLRRPGGRIVRGRTVRCDLLSIGQ
ncbi:MAG: peptidoglycan-binding protein [Paracoccaceae bacterium]